MKILKFGGSSVASAERIKQVYDIVKKYKTGEYAIVFSAMSGVTDKLIACGNTACNGDMAYLELLKTIELLHFETIKALCHTHKKDITLEVEKKFNELTSILRGIYFLKELSPRSLDYILSFGERLSNSIIAAYFTEKGIPTTFIDAREIIKTNANYGNAKVDFTETNAAIKKCFKTIASNHVAIVTGFIGSSAEGNTTTLGRGGSDYTAAILGAALGVECIEIWTDVDGVLTTDPRKVPQAFPLAELSYAEAMEMSHFGAKVIYPPTILPAYNAKIPLAIKNTLKPEAAGTIISHSPSADDYTVKGISAIDEVSLLTLQGSGMVGVPGISARLFGALSSAKVNVILITQGSSEHTITFAVTPSDAQKALEAVNAAFELEINATLIEPIAIEKELSIVAVIGEKMKRTPGVSATLYGALGKNGINIVATAQGSSELNISVVINKNNLSKALNVVHEAFFLSGTRTLNVYMVGTGLVGKALLHQIALQKDKLYSHKAIDLQLKGLANSRKASLMIDGIPVDSWQNTLEQSEQSCTSKQFVDTLIANNLPNSIFVDCTSGTEFVGHYSRLLQNNVSVVTPNKIANSGTYQQYLQLKQSAKKRHASFLYEANVGAGLPVINTLNDLLNSGDEILKIEAVLSGTLSYIFNNFGADAPFAEVVLQAKTLGYTEPDPRDDLSGMDMMRKVLILARECGIPMEQNDINIHPILPKSCIEATSIDAFFDTLVKENNYFADISSKALKANKVLRYIGKIENGKAEISLQAVDSQHPFYSLSGSDNIISFTTARYKERPLVIKGPGAGAEVTAAGVFAQVISLAG